MKIYLGLGSNEGNRVKNLELAVTQIRKLFPTGVIRISPVYETPALLPENAFESWNVPFLNLALEVNLDESKFDDRALVDMTKILQQLKKIEQDLGRGLREKWAPRPIDIDILLWGEENRQTSELTIPHPHMNERAFVLDPLKDLDPSPAFLRAARQHPQHSPVWMGILNVTPDSFSSRGDSDPNAFSESLEELLDQWDDHFVGIIDVGGESTRPGAAPVESTQEWLRLEPVLKTLRERYLGRNLRPQISVDTRHPKTAALALDLGADIINDVSGLSDPSMIGVLRESDAQYVLMHSLSVPAERGNTLSRDRDPVTEILNWFEEKTSVLEKAGIDRSRIILDPGIGFGKTGLQSLAILREMHRLTALPYRVLAGHSRKSFLNPFTPLPAHDRDLESIGVSLHLARQGIDILRVHEPIGHIRAFRAWNHMNRSTPPRNP